MSHTPLGPSGYDWYSNCTAAPAAVSHKVRASSSFSIEGTAGHNVFAGSLDLEISPREFIGKQVWCDDKDIKGYWEVSAEMGEELDKAYEYVLDHTPPGATRMVEQKFNLHKTLPNQIGTGDVVVITADWTELHVMDLKYGKGVPVMVEGNNQAKLYGLGALDDHIPIEHRGKLEKIVLHILQPRLNYMESWSLSRGELEKFRLEARNTYDVVHDPERRKFVPGEKQCKFCPIRSTCRHLAKSNIELVFTDAELREAPVFRDAAEMTPEEQAKLWPNLDFIAAWANNMKLYMDEQARAGANYPDLKLVEGRRGYRNWKDEDSAKNWLVENHQLNDDQLYKKYLISPAQAEKQIGRKKVGDDFKDLFTQNEGAPTLARLDDPRRSVEQALSSEFDDVLGEPTEGEFADLGI